MDSKRKKKRYVTRVVQGLRKEKQKGLTGSEGGET